ncbi:hypothetical protein [Marivita sp. GX14005]|uniref:hypothetical protein n=1 Tax=Marivita sp. GX14005 TaxID=2942276 RepID=UPI0020187BF8|nr:hypothetical protein [Marivita sp. GX14005]MCL3882762.1 hypothetical protein [Marivita sp. GX14005]
MQQNTGISCERKSWIIAAGAGLIVFILLLAAGWGFFASLLIGLIVLAGAGFGLVKVLCPDTGGGEADPAPEAKGSVSQAPSPATAAAASSAVPANQAAASPMDSPAVEKPAPSQTAPETQDALPDVHAAPAVADAEAGAQVTPSRKDEVDASPKAETPRADAEPEAEGEKQLRDVPATQPPAPLEMPDASAPTEGGEGTKPQTLDGARDGVPDNLKEIKGIGPKLEAMLNGMGFYHFDQIANWNADEIAWVNDNLAGFKGRVTRDDWVAQARILASGEDTDFSRRVDKGDVY